MGVRRAPRTKMVVPLRLWGTDSTGKPFNVLGYTLNVSSTGARIAGVKVPLAVGDAVTVQYKQQRALYKVAWVGRPGDNTHEQVGVSLLEADKHIFAELSDPPDYRDEYSGRRSSPPPPPQPAVTTPAPVAVEAPPQPAPPAPVAAEPAPIELELPPEIAAAAETASTATPSSTVETDLSVDDMVARCGRGLLRVDQMVRRKPPSPAVLHDLRDAISRLRQTVWALQQWYELKDESNRPFPLLAYLNAERLRFAVQAVNDLADDIAIKQVEVDPQLLQTFFEISDRLRGASAASLAAGRTIDTSAGADAIQNMGAEIRRTAMPIDAAREYFARELQRIIYASGVALARVEYNEMVCVGSSGNMPPTGTVLEVDEGAAAEAVQSLSLVYCEDTQTDARMNAELCRAAAIASVAFVPVLSPDGKLLGIIEAVSPVARAFDPGRMALLRSAVQLAAELLVHGGAAAA